MRPIICGQTTPSPFFKMRQNRLFTMERAERDRLAGGLLSQLPPELVALVRASGGRLVSLEDEGPHPWPGDKPSGPLQ